MSETVSIGGIPVRLVDTAGIRTALDEAESIGVRKSIEALADADLVLVVRDASRGTSHPLTAKKSNKTGACWNLPANAKPLLCGTRSMRRIPTPWDGGETPIPL